MMRKLFKLRMRRELSQKGLGIIFNVNVENIDTYYQSLLDKGIKAVKYSRDWPWGIGNLLFVTQTGISWFSAKSLGK